MFWVLPGLDLRPVLFNIFLGDLFFIVNERDATSYANDNTCFFVDTNVHDIISALQIAWKSLFEWFNQNPKKANSAKYHFTCSSFLNIIWKNKKLATALVKSF